MPDLISFIIWTFLIFMCFPAIVELYIEKKGIVTVICMYLHKSDARSLENIAEPFEGLPTDVGQVFCNPRFKRAIHSASQNKLAKMYTPVLVRTRVRGTGVIHCFDGTKDLGLTHVVSLKDTKRRDIEFVATGKYNSYIPTKKDLLLNLLIWYATVPLLLFSNAPKLGYSTHEQ